MKTTCIFILCLTIPGFFLTAGAPQYDYHYNGYNYIPAVPDDTGFLGEMEKEILAELNRARTSPRQYAKYISDFRKYYNGRLIRIPGEIPINTQEGLTAVDEAITFLRNVTPCPPLKISRGLSAAAKAHVKDQGPRGFTSHDGTDNSSPFDRMTRFGEIEGYWGENIGFGELSARQMVMQLIIDDGVPDRGHRRNIFKAAFRTVGIAFGEHLKYGTMCVMDFAGKFIEK